MVWNCHVRNVRHWNLHTGMNLHHLTSSYIHLHVWCLHSQMVDQSVRGSNHPWWGPIFLNCGGSGLVRFGCEQKTVFNIKISLESLWWSMQIHTFILTLPCLSPPAQKRNADFLSSLATGPTLEIFKVFVWVKLVFHQNDELRSVVYFIFFFHFQLV